MLSQRSRESVEHACESCACRLRTMCNPPEIVWWSALNGHMHSLTTVTEPRFTFAYNPLDPDMVRMRKKLVLEPALTLAWHEVTRDCCQKGGLVVDVGGNFGWCERSPAASNAPLPCRGHREAPGPPRRSRALRWRLPSWLPAPSCVEDLRRRPP